jgi:hypothetical protein
VLGLLFTAFFLTNFIQSRGAIWGTMEMRCRILGFICYKSHTRLVFQEFHRFYTQAADRERRKVEKLANLIQRDCSYFPRLAKIRKGTARRDVSPYIYRDRTMKLRRWIEIIEVFATQNIGS